MRCWWVGFTLRCWESLSMAAPAARSRARLYCGQLASPPLHPFRGTGMPSHPSGHLLTGGQPFPPPAARTKGDRLSLVMKEGRERRGEASPWFSLTKTLLLLARPGQTMCKRWLFPPTHPIEAITVVAPSHTGGCVGRCGKSASRFPLPLLLLALWQPLSLMGLLTAFLGLLYHRPLIVGSWLPPFP